jgi:hypothetical protein
MTRESLALLRELKMERRICNGWWRNKRTVKTKRVSSTFGLDCIPVSAKPEARRVLENSIQTENIVRCRGNMRVHGINVLCAKKGPRPKQVQEARA